MGAVLPFAIDYYNNRRRRAGHPGRGRGRHAGERDAQGGGRGDPPLTCLLCREVCACTGPTTELLRASRPRAALAQTPSGEWRLIGNQGCSGGAPIYGSKDFIVWYKIGCTKLRLGDCPTFFPLPPLTYRDCSVTSKTVTCKTVTCVSETGKTSCLLLLKKKRAGARRTLCSDV